MFTVKSLGFAVAASMLVELMAMTGTGQAQSAAPHSAYYVAEFELRDAEAIRPYSSGVAATFEPFGGHFIVRGGKVVGLEGTPPGSRTVIIEFPSLEQAQAWYNSPAYTQLRPYRQRSGISRTYIIDGLAP